jgi:type I restriction enzyme S subunit
MRATVKPGYKQTDVGVIPEEWEIVELAEITRVVDSLHQTPSFAEDGYPMVRVTDIKTGNLSFVGTLMVTEAVFTEFTKNYKPKRGDIVLSRVGSYGVSSFVETDEPFCMGQNTVVLHPKLPPRFLYYVLNSRNTQQQIDDGSYGSGYKSLSLKNIKELRIPVPPTDDEQRAIATALSDMDALLAALDRLIAKQRDLKQAAMQQLLTGHTRLPGFHGEWVVKRLGDVSTLSKGTQLHSSETDEGGNFAHLNGGITPSGYTHKTNAPANSIAISEGGNSCGFVQFMTEPYWCGGHCYSVIPSDINNHFLYHALKGQQSAIMALRVGSGLPNVQKTGLLAFNLHFPTSLPEQAAIAEVLGDMDAELSALEQRRDKTRALKQGMMQELLTGRTRLA